MRVLNLGVNQLKINKLLVSIETLLSHVLFNQSINKLYLNVERPPSQGEISLTNMGTF